MLTSEPEVRRGHVKAHLNRFEEMIDTGQQVIVTPQRNPHLQNVRILHRKHKELTKQDFIKDNFINDYYSSRSYDSDNASNVYQDYYNNNNHNNSSYNEYNNYKSHTNSNKNMKDNNAVRCNSAKNSHHNDSHLHEVRSILFARLKNVLFFFSSI